MQSPANQSMQMISVKSRDIIVSVFFDMEGSVMPGEGEKQKLQAFIHLLKAAFEKKYAAMKTISGTNAPTVSTMDVCVQFRIDRQSIYMFISVVRRREVAQVGQRTSTLRSGTKTWWP